MISNIVVLGGGTAGFLAALTLKRRLPECKVRVVRSPEIGTIGVGEGTTQLFPKYLFEQLRLKPAQFYAEVRPTWKLGIRFIWGPRKHFHYTFSSMIDGRWPDLPKNKGFYCEDEFPGMDLWSALMEQDKAFARTPVGTPDLKGHAHVAFHIENKSLVNYLEARCRDFGVQITDGTMAHCKREGETVRALVLESGESVSGDLFVDASGFRSELLGKACEVPFKSYEDALFCEKALIGGWTRDDEPVRPYTIAETMDAGWCWQIEHETFINRGYVYSSRFISDEQALVEFTRKNPKVDPAKTRTVRFRSGRFSKMWVGNVVGVGNASGFVEPLEASAIQVIIVQSRALADALTDSDRQPPPTLVEAYNKIIGESWDDVRDFLAVHYRFNTRCDTPFWRAACSEVALGGAQPLVDFYRENGPSSLARTIYLSPNNAYGLEGYLAMLVGQRVPHAKPHLPLEAETRTSRRYISDLAATAARGFTTEAALRAVRDPAWKWS